MPSYRSSVATAAWSSMRCSRRPVCRRWRGTGPGSGSWPHGHQRRSSHPGPGRSGPRPGDGRGALARAARALPLGSFSRTPQRRRHRGNGGVATVRPGALSYVVGVGDDRGPAGARNTLPPRARYHERHGRGVADRVRRGRRRGDGAPPRGRSGLAARRSGGGAARDRAGIHPRDRVPHARGDQTGSGGGSAVNNGARRVVITGVGGVTPIGTGAEGLWAGLTARTSAVREITRFDPTPYRSKIAAEIPDFRPQDHLDAKRAKRLDRFSQLAVTSARFALADAALDPARERADRAGAMMGSALGGVAFAESQVERFRAEGPRGLDPALALAVFPGAASCNIAIEFGFTGPNSTNAMSCASGTIAVGEAFHAIREARADVMLAGGAEAPLAPMTYAAFSVIRAMSTRNHDPAHASRPFDEDRDGFVMGEGAAVLVLEERTRAVARGARIYAELAGYAFTNDAYHMTAPRPDGREAARAMRLPPPDAPRAPPGGGDDNTHGSSTPLNDSTETAAIKQVFGAHAYRLSVSGTKGYYGHALGASGAIEAAICALAVDRRWLPPTINLERPDPACDLDCLPREGRAAAPDIVLTNSFGFGGINASLVLRRT